MSPTAFLKIMPRDGVGFYSWETSENIDIPGWPPEHPLKYRMTGKRGSINTEYELQNGGILFLRCSHPNLNNDPVRVEIFADNKMINQEIFSDHHWKNIVLSGDDVADSRAITLQVSRTWNPKLAGISDDKRDLGVAVAVLSTTP